MEDVAAFVATSRRAYLNRVVSRFPLPIQTAAVERRDAAIRETDDGLIPPASLATSRTPLPIARNVLAFSILAVGIGGRPNRIDKLRAAACPRKIRSRRLGANAAPSIHRSRAVTSRSMSQYPCPARADTARRRLFGTPSAARPSRQATARTDDRPEQHPIDLTAADRIDQRHLSRPSIWPPCRCRPIGECLAHSPTTFGCDRLETLDLIVGGKQAVRACSSVNRDANSHGQSISRILILTSELIEPPPPVAGLVETTRSLQLTEPPHDEFLRVEMHGLTWTNLSYPSGMQHGRCGVEAEEVQSPSVWPTALDTIKEGAMTVFQQALPEEVAMTIRDEPLTRQRDRP